MPDIETFDLMQNISSRKRAILDHSERIAPQRQLFRRKAAFFHAEDLRYLKFLIPEGLRVLEIGCGTGDVLAALKPSYRRRPRLQPGHDRAGESVAPGPGVQGRGRRGPGGGGVAAGSVRRHPDRRHHRLARRLPGDARIAASALHALDAAGHRLLFASVGAAAEGRGMDRLAGAAAAPERHVARRYPCAGRSCRLRPGQGGTAAVVADAAVGRRPLSQSLRLDAAGHPPSQLAALFGVPLLAALPGRDAEIGDRARSRAQRARQYRAGRQEPAALLRRHGNPFCRGQQQGRHLRGGRAGHRGAIPTATSS